MTNASSHASDNGVVIVTGAAGGMGAAIAAELATQKRQLLLTDLHAQPLQLLATRLGAQALAGDIASGGFLQQLMAALGGRPLDALVHTAGVSPTMDDGARIFEVNYSASVRLVEAVVPALRRGSVVVLFASNSAHMVAGAVIDKLLAGVLRGRLPPLVKLALRSPRLAYPLSKRAVQLYAQRMAPALGKRGARIVSLSPGSIDTPMAQKEMAAGPMMGKLLAVTAVARLGDPREIAAAVSFLISARASYITGTDLLVDGGTIAGIAAAGGVGKL